MTGNLHCMHPVRKLDHAPFVVPLRQYGTAYRMKLELHHLSLSFEADSKRTISSLPFNVLLWFLNVREINFCMRFRINLTIYITILYVGYINFSSNNNNYNNNSLLYYSARFLDKSSRFRLHHVRFCVCLCA